VFYRCADNADTRAQAQGKGCETAAYYGARCHITHLDIANIHVVRNSLDFLLSQACRHALLVQDNFAAAVAMPNHNLAAALSPPALTIWRDAVRASGWFGLLEQVWWGVFVVLLCLSKGC
jgi:hypothetical protein